MALFSILAPLAMRAPPAGLTFRFGERADVLPIAATLLKHKMNPLFVDHERFIVCESASTGERVGFGQIRQLSASKAPDPTRFDARPGSGDLQAELDDDAWENFESLGPVPSGLDSLPWSPGYRALQERAVLQRARRRARSEQGAYAAEPLWELASVWVDARWRGRGVGSALVRRLLRRHEQRGRALRDVYLLTLAPTSAWYAQFGFATVDAPERVPSPMALEVAAGTMLSAVLGNELVCMRAGAEVAAAAEGDGEAVAATEVVAEAAAAEEEEAEAAAAARAEPPTAPRADLCAMPPLAQPSQRWVWLKAGRREGAAALWWAALWWAALWRASGCAMAGATTRVPSRASAVVGASLVGDEHRGGHASAGSPSGCVPTTAPSGCVPERLRAARSQLDLSVQASSVQAWAEAAEMAEDEALEPRALQAALDACANERTACASGAVASVEELRGALRRLAARGAAGGSGAVVGGAVVGGAVVGGAAGSSGAPSADEAMRAMRYGTSARSALDEYLKLAGLSGEDDE